MAFKSGMLSKRIFRSGQLVLVEGMYGDLWGDWLPLMQGDTFPQHPEMGDTKWTYSGPLGTRLPLPRWSGSERGRGW
ncbi:hypothetical protein [Paenibacillus sp. R14(2021)]|uniref:hypothetical protein n=1 Tax=Paenibacillus sp. R14(2021) TaxID=2859228 RepID=UPI001C616293|nr:hypothetical protein [Paenibacillus sp. R14(2021)]